MTVRVTDVDEIYINSIKNFSGIKVIIDNIFTWSTNFELILIYFKCVRTVFKSYHVSFRFDKCEFPKDLVEYVGHNLTPTGNFQEKSKFNVTNDWKLLISSQFLHYFISLIHFYRNYAPYFKVCIKHLRKL